MRTKLIKDSAVAYPNFKGGAGVAPTAFSCVANTETYEYECPCGNGKIVEEHDNIPGFRDHFIWIYCDACRKKYRLDTSKGVRNWDLVEINASQNVPVNSNHTNK